MKKDFFTYGLIVGAIAIIYLWWRSQPSEIVRKDVFFEGVTMEGVEVTTYNNGDIIANIGELYTAKELSTGKYITHLIWNDSTQSWDIYQYA